MGRFCTFHVQNSSAAMESMKFLSAWESGIRKVLWMGTNCWGVRWGVARCRSVSVSPAQAGRGLRTQVNSFRGGPDKELGQGGFPWEKDNQRRCFPTRSLLSPSTSQNSPRLKWDLLFHLYGPSGLRSDVRFQSISNWSSAKVQECTFSPIFLSKPTCGLWLCHLFIQQCLWRVSLK